MAEAFRGEFYQKVDTKARVSIPAAFRRILDADDVPSAEFPRTRLIMIYGGKSRKFVECYSKAGADRLAKLIQQLAPGTKERLKAERNLITLSATVEIDEDGRIVLPAKVREKIGLAAEDLLGAEAAFAGTLDRFQLWKRATYEAEVVSSDDDDDDDLPGGADILSLLKNTDQGA